MARRDSNVSNTTAYNVQMHPKLHCCVTEYYGIGAKGKCSMFCHVNSAPNLAWGFKVAIVLFEPGQ